MLCRFCQSSQLARSCQSDDQPKAYAARGMCPVIPSCALVAPVLECRICSRAARLCSARPITQARRRNFHTAWSSRTPRTRPIELSGERRPLLKSACSCLWQGSGASTSSRRKSTLASAPCWSDRVPNEGAWQFFLAVFGAGGARNEQDRQGLPDGPLNDRFLKTKEFSH